MEAISTVEQWYAEYREKNKIQVGKSISPIDLIFFLAENKQSQYVPEWKIESIISNTITRLEYSMDCPSKDLFITIFGSTDLWPLFKSHHHNILRFLADIDESDRNKFIVFIRDRIKNKINS